MNSIPRDQNGRIEFVQFAPSTTHPEYPGVYGWGFDVGGFRFVINGPSQKNQWLVNLRIKELDKEAHSKTMRSKGRRDIVAEPTRRKNHDHANQQEHGPAHVHVYHRESGRQTRFELLEDAMGNDTVQLLYPNQPKKNELKHAEEKIVIPILEEAAPEFIQLWRELYVDSNKHKLSGLVSRIDKRYGHTVITRVRQDGWLEHNNGDGKTVEPPPNMSGATTTKKSHGHSEPPAR